MKTHFRKNVRWNDLHAMPPTIGCVTVSPVPSPNVISVPEFDKRAATKDPALCGRCVIVRRAQRARDAKKKQSDSDSDSGIGVPSIAERDAVWNIIRRAGAERDSRAGRQGGDPRA